MTTTLPPRNQVPIDQTWDLSSIFPTPADWEAACQQLVAALPSLSALYPGGSDEKHWVDGALAHKKSSGFQEARDVVIS
jgi:oligoendopeptidase F